MTLEGMQTWGWERRCSHCGTLLSDSHRMGSAECRTARDQFFSDVREALSQLHSMKANAAPQATATNEGGATARPEVAAPTAVEVRDVPLALKLAVEIEEQIQACAEMGEPPSIVLRRDQADELVKILRRATE